MRNKLLISKWLLIGLLSFFGIFSRVNGQSADKMIRELSSSKALKGSVLGVQIADLESGLPVLSFNSETLMIPASTQKMLITLAAIDQLGAEYSFHTKLYISGKVNGAGTLNGDFIIASGGDPTFASSRGNAKMNIDLIFQTIHKTLKKLGIKQIEGNLVLLLPEVADPSAGSWLWEDLSNYYGGGAWGFNFMENEYTVYFRQQPKVGQLCQIERVVPEIPGLKLTSRVYSGAPGSGDQAYIMGGPEDLTKNIVGTIPAGKTSFKIKGSIPNPPATFLRMLKIYLDNKTIRSGGMKLRYGRPVNEKLVGKFSSRPLRELVRDCNFHSINLHAEAFGKAMFLAKRISMLSGYPGNDEWEKLFEDYTVGPEGMHIKDACGLSSANLITPSKMTGFIVMFNKKLGLGQMKYILPRAGLEGTVKNFLENQQTGQQIWLKSGSIEGVLNYVGIFRSVADNRHYAFAVMVNHSIHPEKDVRKALEQFMLKAVNSHFN